MKPFGWFFARLRYKITKNEEVKNRFFRKNGIKIGKNTLIYSNIITADSYLIEIGDGVVISSEVVFITHDYSIQKVIPNKANLFGKIIVGDDCFIGERATLLYGISICRHVIIAAGSVVTKSISEEYTIWGGNPAKKISTWNQFAQKSLIYAQNVGNVKDLIKEHPEILVKR